jgi:hypothetical protein
MWILNTYFFAMIFLAIRTGDLWLIIPIAVVFMWLHTWLEELEDNGTDLNIQRPNGHDYYLSDRLDDDTSSDMDNTKT